MLVLLRMTLYVENGGGMTTSFFEYMIIAAAGRLLKQSNDMLLRNMICLLAQT